MFKRRRFHQQKQQQVADAKEFKIIMSLQFTPRHQINVHVQNTIKLLKNYLLLHIMNSDEKRLQSSSLRWLSCRPCALCFIKNVHDVGDFCLRSLLSLDLTIASDYHSLINYIFYAHFR